MSSTSDTHDGDAESALDYDALTDALDPDTAEQLVEDIQVEMPGDDGDSVPLSAVMVDILLAHQDLDDYKAAGLSMTQALKERRLEAETAGDDTAAALLREFEESAFGIYLRVQYGDREVVDGDRDGEYSGYFGTDTDEGRGDTDAAA